MGKKLFEPVIWFFIAVFLIWGGLLFGWGHLAVFLVIGILISGVIYVYDEDSSFQKGVYYFLLEGGIGVACLVILMSFGIFSVGWWIFAWLFAFCSCAIIATSREKDGDGSFVAIFVGIFTLLIMWLGAAMFPFDIFDANKKYE